MRVLRLMTVAAAAAVGALLALQAPLPASSNTQPHAATCGCHAAASAHARPAGKHT